MKIINFLKTALGILILIVLLQPLLGAEKVEGEGREGGQGPVQQELKAELDPQIISLIEKQLIAFKIAFTDEEAKRNRAETEKQIADLKASISATLKSQEEAHKEALMSLEGAHKKDLQEQLEKISKVIKQDPPSFKQRITSSKYIWGIGAVTFGGMAISFFHSCDSFYSIPYATVRAVVENLPLLINSYYVAKIIQESATIKGSLASQAAKSE